MWMLFIAVMVVTAIVNAWLIVRCLRALPSVEKKPTKFIVRSKGDEKYVYYLGHEGLSSARGRAMEFDTRKEAEEARILYRTFAKNPVALSVEDADE
jgi:hypothetical protein